MNRGLEKEIRPLLPIDSVQGLFSAISFTHRACCGPVLPTSCDELAVTWKSAMAPDSIPRAFEQVAEREEREQQELIAIQL